MAKNKVNLTEKYRATAANFLSTHHKLGKVERNFSGIITPKFGDFVVAMQFDRGQLVGTIIVPVDHVKNIITQLEHSVESTDYMKVMEEVDADSSDSE